MIEYKKIKIASKDDPKRFYRVLAVKDDITLDKLGEIIARSVNAWLGHAYLFRTKDYSYVPDEWVEDSFFDSNLALSEHYLSQLDEKFSFEYDTGEGWDFSCAIMKSTYKCEEDEDGDYPAALVIEGKGQGIFEDDHGTLWRYLAGEIDPESSEEDLDNGLRLPINMDFEKYGDFDKPLDLDEYVYYDPDYYDDEEDDDDFYDYDDDYDDLDEFEEMDIKSIAALSIFSDPFVKDIYLKLLGKYSMNQAFDMIAEVFINVSDVDGFEEYDKALEEELNKLI